MIPYTSEVVWDGNAQTITQIKDVGQLIDQKLRTIKLESNAKNEQVAATQNELQDNMMKSMQKQRMKLHQISTLITNNNNALISMIKKMVNDDDAQEVTPHQEKEN